MPVYSILVITHCMYKWLVMFCVRLHSSCGVYWKEWCSMSLQLCQNPVCGELLCFVVSLKWYFISLFIHVLGTSQGKNWKCTLVLQSSLPLKLWTMILSPFPQTCGVWESLPTCCELAKSIRLFCVKYSLSISFSDLFLVSCLCGLFCWTSFCADIWKGKRECYSWNSKGKWKINIFIFLYSRVERQRGRIIYHLLKRVISITFNVALCAPCGMHASQI